MKDSQRLWSQSTFDLQQVHNSVNWTSHLDYLRSLKKSGRIRYLGVTTSHGRRHRGLESIMRNEPLDLVQLSYNILNREAEERLIPLAQERGIAIIANRPYQRGYLMDRYRLEPLPPWRDEVGVANWAEFFLKFIISHPGVTCVIPATSQVVHMQENMDALPHARVASHVLGEDDDEDSPADTAYSWAADHHDIKLDTPLRLEPSDKDKTAEVFINSDPEGATVFFGQELMGRTALRKDLPIDHATRVADSTPCGSKKMDTRPSTPRKPSIPHRLWNSI